MTASNIGLTSNPAQSILHTQAGYCWAEQYSLLKVAGKDAATFLQSQLTNDINQLKPGLGQFSCLLDRKAYVKAYFHLFKNADPNSQPFFILAEKEQLPVLIENLEQYRFAAEVEFIDCSKDGKFFALQGSRVNRLFVSLSNDIELSDIANLDAFNIDLGGKSILTFRHSITGENGYFFWVPNSNLDAFKNSIDKACKNLGFIELTDTTMTKARIEAGMPKFGIDFDQNSLLPETGLIDKTVSYTKGCFVGQEILARVRSHGVPAKALIGLILESNGSALESLSFPTNSPIFDSGEEIGIIKSNTYSAILNKSLAIALLKRDYRVPQKEFSAQINNTSAKATVTILPFINAHSKTALAKKLYEEAVQKYVKESENTLPVESINLLKEVLLLDSKFEDAYEALAVILSKHNQLEEAIVLMKNLAQLNPDSVMAHTNLSLFYVQQGFKELAEEEKAISLSIRMRLAAAQMASKQNDDADKEKAERQKRMEMFKQVLAIDAEDFFANAGTGECLVAEKDFATAIPYLKKAIELKPIHLAAYLDLAKAYTGSNNTRLAKDVLNSGIAVATKRGDMAVLQQLQNELKKID